MMLLVVTSESMCRLKCVISRPSYRLLSRLPPAKDLTDTRECLCHVMSDNGLNTDLKNNYQEMQTKMGSVSKQHFRIAKERFPALNYLKICSVGVFQDIIVPSRITEVVYLF